MSKDGREGEWPLFWAAFSFGAGVWVGAWEWRPPAWWVVAVVALGGAAVWYLARRSWAAKVLALAVWFLLGCLLIQVKREARGDPRIFALADGQEVTLTGHVVREGYAREAGPRSMRATVDIETENAERAGKSWPLRAGVRLTVYEKGSSTGAATGASEIDGLAIGGVAGETPIAPLSYGTRVRVRAKLHPARNYRNPGAFDYEGYLRENGIAVLGSAEAGGVERLPGFAGSRVQQWRARAHASIVRKIHELWPERQAALMDAMVLGEESFLKNATRTEYQRSGTYHVLVVSGINLSILAVAIFWTLRRVRVDPAVAAVATVVVTFAYAFVVGVGPPVWRAALMLAVYLGARLLYRGRNMMNAIGAAALGILIADPRALFGASFQLTFLAVVIIAGIVAPLLERTTLPYARGLRLLEAASYDFQVPARVAQFRLELRMIAGRLGRFVGARAGIAIPAAAMRVGIGAGELVFLSAVMQAGLAVEMAYHFHRATTMGMPANLAVIPLTEVLMPAAAAAVGLGYFSAAVAKPAVWISGWALDGIAGTVHWLGGAQRAGVSIADLRVAMPSAALMVVAAAVMAAAMMAVRWKRWAGVAAVGALLAVAGWIAFVPARPQFRRGVMEMTSLDVGQGDATLLVTPGGKTMLIDAGGLPQWMHSDFDLGEQVVSPYLWGRGLDHLDVAVITHPHADHLGGMPAVLGNFHPRELWVSVDRAVGELAPVVEEARRAGIPVVVKKEGDEAELDGVRLRVLAPGRDQDTGAMRANDDCLVMTAAYGGEAALLEGDAERVVERRVVEEHPAAQVLKVAHHGSASATSRELLETVKPKFAVISVGARNGYGHPRREVLERLERAGVRTFRTDEDGAVSFYLGGQR